MVGIIAAMDKEIAGWLDIVAVREINRIADKTFYVGTLAGEELVIAQSGIGKVNAAITAALLFSHYRIEYVINTGVAGGLLPTAIGDIVIGRAVLYGDVDLRMIDSDLPYGQMAGDPLYAVADPVLFSQAVNVLEKLGYQHRSGVIASADRFTTARAELSYILAHTADVIACDMESMAVALTAVKFGIPFVVIRGISDVIDDAGQIEAYHDVVDDVCSKTTAFVAAFLRG
ncbi:MAG: 5'-methylthioadenosine/adenosylhomocysteine nucleosidase [bacterium]